MLQVENGARPLTGSELLLQVWHHRHCELVGTCGICNVFHVHGELATDHKSRDDPSGGVVLARCGGLLAIGGGCWPAIGRSNRLFCHYTDWKHEACRVACSERVYCANAFRMGSSNSPFTTSCACASLAFLAGVISWSVDSSLFSLEGDAVSGPIVVPVTFRRVLQD
jgi:hypothetical protein